MGISSSSEICGKNLWWWAFGFCDLSGQEFRLAHEWWTGGEPTDAPGSCAIVGGHMQKEHMDLPCTKAVDVDVLCEIDWVPADSYKGM